MTGLAQVKQDTSQHLAFKGVPIDGTIDNYVSKMKQNGFTHIQIKDRPLAGLGCLYQARNS